MPLFVSSEKSGFPLAVLLRGRKGEREPEHGSPTLSLMVGILKSLTQNPYSYHSLSDTLEHIAPS